MKRVPRGAANPTHALTFPSQPSASMPQAMNRSFQSRWLNTKIFQSLSLSERRSAVPIVEHRFPKKGTVDGTPPATHGPKAFQDSCVRDREGSGLVFDLNRKSILKVQSLPAQWWRASTGHLRHWKNMMDRSTKTFLKPTTVGSTNTLGSSKRRAHRRRET